MASYRVNNAKFSGYQVGDVVNADDLSPKLNIEALVECGILSPVSRKQSKAEQVSDSSESTTEEAIKEPTENG